MFISVLRHFFRKTLLELLKHTLPKTFLLDPRHFDTWQGKGYHILPCWYGSPIPDIRGLNDSFFDEPSELIGIDMNELQQIELLERFQLNYSREYSRLSIDSTDIPFQYHLNNSSFRSVDGEILYCMIRHFQPKRVYEIGSGYTTYLSAQALRENEKIYGGKSILYAFEPFPNSTLKKGFPGLTKLIEQKVQEIPVSRFQELKENDILFIDSTHVLKAGSDVQYEYLEILPRLNRGVIVHLHDIFLPKNYPREWTISKHWFWNEQYFLQAFLQFNDSFEIIWAGSYMHLKHPEKLCAYFPSYNPQTEWPGSFWMRKTQ